MVFDWAKAEVTFDEKAIFSSQTSLALKLGPAFKVIST
jgi:hypothetical protein